MIPESRAKGSLFSWAAPSLEPLTQYMAWHLVGQHQLPAGSDPRTLPVNWVMSLGFALPAAPSLPKARYSGRALSAWHRPSKCGHLWLMTDHRIQKLRLERGESCVYVCWGGGCRLQSLGGWRAGIQTCGCQTSGCLYIQIFAEPDQSQHGVDTEKTQRQDNGSKRDP